MGGDAVVGAVAAGHPRTAAAGAAILAAGGTAADAAVAAVLAGSACEGVLSGLGAGGFLLVAPAGEPPTLLDAFVAVPGLGPGGARLRPEMLDRFTVPFGGAEQEFHIGPASVAVPGLLSGLLAAWRRFGRLPLADVAAPAIRLAREGWEITAEVAHLHEILTAMLTRRADAAARYAPAGRPLRAGDRTSAPELAVVLEEVVRSERDVVLDGAVGAAILGGLRREGCLITREDLTAYEVVERAPLRVRFRDLEVVTNPPPSSGGILIAAALAHVAREPPRRDTAGHHRAVAAAGRFANAMRDDRFAQRLAEDGFAERFLAEAARALAGAAPEAGGGVVGSTTHVSVIDADGNAVSVTSSNGSGSGVMVPGTGVLLNNMLGEADLNPSGFGAVEPGERMTSMMAPTVLRRDGEAVLAVGSAGSNRLRSAIVQTLVGVVDVGLDVAEAVRRPRVHHEDGGVDVEGGVPEEAVGALAAAGHALRRWDRSSLYFGGVSAVSRTAGRVAGAGDFRRGGAAVGVTRAGELVPLGGA